MEKILILIGTLLVTGIMHAQATNTENYIKTQTYLEPVTSSSSTAKQIETVQYFDGLGRAKQVVNVKASPLGKDVVNYIEYDQFGRQVKDYLPVPQSGTLNGAIIPNPLGNVSSVYGGEKIYTEKILENSPLDRPLQQIQVGNDWVAKPVQFGYDANTNSDYVRKYETSTVWDATNNMMVTSVQLLQYFLPNQLYKNTMTDEDGNTTIEFKNGEGQTILVRKVLSPTENADTYYVYNEYDLLAYVIPPLASAPTVEQVTVNNLYYQYRYDGRKRLVEKKLPGKGWEYMVYDKQDRLVLTQDANLRIQGKWFFTKYDQFSRPIYTGILDSPPGRIQQVNTIEGLGSNNEVRSSSSWNNSGMDVYYTNNTAYPTTNFNLLSVNYYDVYPSYSFNPAFPTDIQGAALLTETPSSDGKSTKGLPVMSLVKNIEDDNWTKSYTYYDTKGRSVGGHSINHLGGYTRTESQLDFAGVPLKAVTRHKRLNTDTEKAITETFEYDLQNRLKKHYHQVDNQPQELLTENSYNELSQLKNKKVGNNLQSIDYSYNIRGWMTKINDPAALNGKLFGYEIKYDYPIDIEKRYNGNITEVDWRTASDNVFRRYDYRYDGLNRLTLSHYREPLSFVSYNNFYNEETAYDLNGNITRMWRNTKNTSGTAESIDNLTYTYIGNRLTSVSDASQNSSGYPYLPVPNTIGYDNGNNDGNGNMTENADKGLKITYNFLNLPTTVSTGTGKALSKSVTGYTYRADGVKVSKTYKQGLMQNITTNYLDGFQYDDKESSFISIPMPPALQFVPTSEGYYDFNKNKYIYNYTDHLGNVRLSYLNNGSGAEIIEENNYYPFGLKHTGYNEIPKDFSKSYNEYKYNGKELQETGMYDYGARMYMPDLGRFGTIDQRSQYTHEAYSYVWNNPISFNDPTGMSGELSGASGPGEPPVKTIEIKPIVITVYRPVKLESRGFDFSSTAMLSSIAMTGSRYPNPYTIAAAGIAGIILWNTPKIYHATEAWREAEIIINVGPKSLDNEEDQDIDINGVSIPVDDSGLKKPTDQTIKKGNNKFDFAQRGKNNGKADDIEALKAKQEAGTLTNLEKQKLKRHEKNTGERGSRQSKDKKK